MSSENNVIDRFPIPDTHNTTVRPVQLLFIKLSHVRRAPLMTSQKNALILSGTLTFQMTLANGHR